LKDQLAEARAAAEGQQVTLAQWVASFDKASNEARQWKEAAAIAAEATNRAKSELGVLRAKLAKKVAKNENLVEENVRLKQLVQERPTAEGVIPQRERQESHDKMREEDQKETIEKEEKEVQRLPVSVSASPKRPAVDPAGSPATATTDGPPTAAPMPKRKIRLRHLHRAEEQARALLTPEERYKQDVDRERAISSSAGNAAVGAEAHRVQQMRKTGFYGDGPPQQVPMEPQPSYPPNQPVLADGNLLDMEQRLTAQLAALGMQLNQ